jgi:hypothetical protein
MICVNMQTSFMHPPFGFALFYLRGISDTLFKNGALPRKVESKDIYLGAIPWVLMQLVLVGIVIFFPQTVTVFLDKPVVVDTESATKILQGMGAGAEAQEAASAASSASAAEGAQPAASAAAEEDPMKALEESMKRDEAAASAAARR